MTAGEVTGGRVTAAADDVAIGPARAGEADALLAVVRRGYREVRREPVDERVTLVHLEKRGPAA